MAQAHYINADGNRIDLNLPDYAMESTQAEMLKILAAQLKADDKTLKIYNDLFKSTAAYHKASERSETEGNAELKKQTKTLDKLTKGSTDVYAGKRLEVLGKHVNNAANHLISFNKLLAANAIAGLGLLASRINTVGDTLAEMGTVGLGLQGVGDSTVGTIVSLNRLGLSVKEASELMMGSASTIAAIGQAQFTQVNTTLASMTGSGAKFGLTMSQLAAIAQDDLETRQKLGILDNLNASQASQRSADLYQQQLNATQLLGKSIQDIRDASKTTLRENAEFALRVQSIGVKLGDEVARGFVQNMEKGLGNLAASGLGPNLIDSIGNEIGAAVAFASDSGQELFATLNYVNPALVDSVRNMNEFAKSNNPKVVAKVGSEMENFRKTLLDSAANMTPAAFEAFSQQLLAGSLGPAGREFAASLAELRQAAEKYGKTTAAQFNGLAQGAKTFDNAISQFTGGISSIFTDISGALGPAVGGLASAFQDTADLQIENGKVVKGQIGISTAFKMAMSDVSETLIELFGGADGDFSNLGDTLRSKLVPAIQDFAEWFKNGGAKGIMEALKQVGYYMGAILSPIQALFNVLGTEGGVGAKLEAFFGTFGDHLDTLGGKIGVLVAAFVGITKVFSVGNKVLDFASKTRKFLGLGRRAGGGGGGADGADVVSRGVSGFTKAIAKGSKNIAVALRSLGKGIGDGIAGIADGLGKGVGAIGKGVGVAIGGILQGLAAGISAFKPQVLMGAVILGASIAVIGAGIAGAAWIMGEALPTFAEGLEKFAAVDGDNLLNVAKGVAAMGGALALLGGGSVIGAIGNLMGGALDALNEFFGGDSLEDKLNNFANMDIDSAKITANADAIMAYANSLAKLSTINIAALDKVVSQSVNLKPIAKSPLDELSDEERSSLAWSQMEANAFNPGPAGPVVRMRMPNSSEFDTPANRTTILKSNIPASLTPPLLPPTPMLPPAQTASTGVTTATPVSTASNVDKLIEIQQENARLLNELLTEQRKSNKKTEEQISVIKKASW